MTAKELNKQLSLWDLSPTTQQKLSPQEAALRKQRKAFIAENRELIKAARREVNHKPPLFSHHLGIYQQGIFKAGVREYFTETGQTLISRHGYD